MIEDINWYAKQALHRQLARGILATPPIAPTSDRLVIFSMVGSKVLYPYLVAVKSLFARLGKGRVVLLDDGTLTAADRRILADHLGDPEIRTIAEAPRADVPEGGCWERLVTLLELARDDYVIQLDSDTVTLGPVPEVADAVARNRPFILPGEAEAEGTGILTLPDFLAAHYPDGGVDPGGGAHVQQAIESNWAAFPDPACRYVRGCAGFAGFPRGGPGPEAAADFSRKAEAIVGAAKWASWGSEQVASNFLIANLPGARLLPAARYLNYWNAAPGPEAAFLHFIGTYRFHGLAYLRATRAAIAALRAAPARRAA